MLGPKNQPKILPKRGPNPSKIHAKNKSFFNIDFLGVPASILMGFGGGFGKGLDALEASWGIFLGGGNLSPVTSSEKWLNFEAPGLDFRSISRDFWGPSGGGVGSSQQNQIGETLSPT